MSVDVDFTKPMSRETMGMLAGGRVPRLTPYFADRERENTFLGIRGINRRDFGWYMWGLAVGAGLVALMWLGASMARADTIDYVLAGYADETAAKADPALAPYCAAQPDGPCAWDMSRVLPGLDIFTVDGTGARVSTLPGFHVGIGLTARDPALDADSHTLMVADRDMASAGNPAFILQTVLTHDQMVPMRLQPTFQGASYPFGNPP